MQFLTIKQWCLFYGRQCSILNNPNFFEKLTYEIVICEAYISKDGEINTQDLGNNCHTCMCIRIHNQEEEEKKAVMVLLSLVFR